ncbi:PROTEIN FAR1-RELATED SEQUENCE 10-RELATED [Salix purpurea]|uniref:Protein FAR1-RELATED SEQUENCE n=1 Tax=Salix purpurea TaxID=77065 RepID=A0A9Q0T4L7_SALPP|nr:PROTEIN FAR1-RELATED SEQUENCE 10-RELATED [Salix purpurea]
MMTERNHKIIDDMIDLQDNVPADDVVGGNIVDVVHSRDVAVVDSPKRAVVMFEGDVNYELCDGIEFGSHEEAYSFYQEYAKSMGFTTSIKNSRRSKKSKEFIDAKFACSRYGVTPESDSGNSRRSTVKKTDCKASMHVKRRPDGKWIIHEFVKEHNHELLPALAYHFRIHRNVKLAEKNNIDILHAVSERTRKMYVEMSRQSGGYQNFGFVKSEMNMQFEKGRHLALDEGDAQVVLEYFKHVKKENANFFYAIDLNEDQRLRNLFWVDAKSREDYISFNDAVCFETFYVKYHEKLPFAPFVGVNHHSQPILLGCAFIADESRSSFVWLMKTWLRAMGGQAPKVIVTDVDKTLKAAIEEAFPNTRHCFSLWHILERLPETLSHVIKRHEKFLPKFHKCIFKSWTDDRFDMRWWKMVTQFELQDDEWIQSLYEDRKKWVPTYLGDTFLAGTSAAQRSESMSAFFDKYIHRKITMKEFMKQYGTILQNRHALIVLQICGLSTIPPHYILKRWTKDAKSRQPLAVGTERAQTRAQRYNDLCKLAIEMSEEGSLSEESYNIVLHTLVEALKNCVNVNNCNNSVAESSTCTLTHREAEEENQGSLVTKSSKKKNPVRKRKVQSDPDVMLVEAPENLQQMENLSSEGINLSGYYGTQQNVQGLVQLNLMEPPHDGYYVNQQSMQGLGQLNSIAPSHDGFFGNQQSMHGLGQFDFRPPTGFSYSMQDDTHLRSSHMHGGASRNA